MLDATDSGVWGITHVGPYALVMVVTLLLSTQVMGWAAGVGGGFSLSTLGAMGTATRYGAGYASGGLTMAYSKLRGRGRSDLGADAATAGAGTGAQAARSGRSGAFNQGRQRSQDQWQDRNRRDRNRS